MTEPLRTIIDRDKALSDTNRAFESQLGLMREIVNYGSNLIVRAFESSPKDVVAVVVLPVLLKQVVSMLDGVEVLASNGALHASNTCLRALFEAHLYATWILAGDSENRSRHYYVAELRQRRLWASRLVPGTPEYSDFSHVSSTLPPFDPAISLQAPQDINLIDQFLASQNYSPINVAFDNYWRKKHDPPWHAPCGATSIRKIAEQLGVLHEYDVFYSILSGITHGSCFRNHAAINGGAITFEQIRNLESFGFVFNVSLSTAFRFYRSVLEKYRPAELKNFSLKYLNEWRDPFQSVPEIRYVSENDDTL